MQASMQIKEFAAANRLKTKNMSAEDVIPGKYGELAEMNDGGLLRLRLLAVPRSAIMTGALRNRRRQAEAGGLKLKWRGDSESIWIFDPADQAQAALAIKLVHPKRKRVVNLTDEQRQTLRDRLQSARAKANVLIQESARKKRFVMPKVLSEKELADQKERLKTAWQPRIVPDPAISSTTSNVIPS